MIRSSNSQKLKILRSSTYRGNLIPKTALLSQKEALRESNFKRYVEGECIHIGNLIPKTALSSQKAALRESNFKRYGRRQIYTHRNCDSQKRPFSRGAKTERKQLYGNQISRGMVEGECMYTHRKFDSQNGHFEPESSFTGIKFQEVW